jgi:hypothetical protein
MDEEMENGVGLSAARLDSIMEMEEGQWRLDMRKVVVIGVAVEETVDVLDA